MIRGVLLDLAGVLYEGDHAINGAIGAVKRMAESGLPVRLITNSTRKPRRVLLQKLAQFGFDIAENQLFTPASAARAVLEESGHTPHLLIHPDLAEDFASLSPDGTGISVVVGDAADYFTYDAMNSAFRAVMDGADLLALANNRSFSSGDGKLNIDIGAYVAGLEFATGKQAMILGKPAPDFFKSALASMGVDVTEAVMIGDDAEADVAGALTAGLKAAVLVRTGKYREGDECRYHPAPSFVAGDLSEAVEWVLSHRAE